MRSHLHAALVLSCLLVLLMGACTRPLLRPTGPEYTAEEARQRLEREGMRRMRMSGYLRARMPGLSGLLASAEVDVVVETPAKIFLSIRSFFDQPMYVVATNGTRATAIDSTGGQPVFLSGPATAYALEELLGAELWPFEAVAVFLAIAPAAGAEATRIEYDHAAGTYTLWLREPSGRLSEVQARMRDDALVSWVAYQENRKPAFSVLYPELSTLDGVAFPERWELTAYGSQGTQSLVFDAIDLELNGAPFAPELFELLAPPGAPSQSISATGTGPN